MNTLATAARHPAASETLLRRLWIYQADRFPLGKTALLLAVFSAASISVSAHLAGRALPSAWTFVVAWLVAIVILFQIRACDEYKDLEDDRRFRPERPIPSGLVSLRLIPLAGAGRRRRRSAPHRKPVDGAVAGAAPGLGLAWADDG